MNDAEEIYASSNQNIIEIKPKKIILEDVNNKMTEINKVEVENSPNLNHYIPIEVLQLNSIFSFPDTIYLKQPPQERVLNFNAVISVFAPIIAFPIAPLSLIWGLIGLNQIIKYPEKYSGKGFAIVGIIISSLVFIAEMIFLAVMMG